MLVEPHASKTCEEISVELWPSAKTQARPPIPDRFLTHPSHFLPVSFFQLAACKSSIFSYSYYLSNQHSFNTTKMATLNLPKEPLSRIIVLPVPAFSDIAKPSNDVRLSPQLIHKTSGVMMDHSLIGYQLTASEQRFLSHCRRYLVFQVTVFNLLAAC